MATNALHPRDPELVELARGAGDLARGVARFAVETALRAAPVEADVVAKALDALSGLDTTRRSELRRRLHELAEALEETYWALSDRADHTAERDAAFSRARAVSALECALVADPAEATIEAVYEAQAALSGEQAHQLVSDVKAMLRAHATQK